MAKKTFFAFRVIMTQNRSTIIIKKTQRKEQKTQKQFQAKEFYKI